LTQTVETGLQFTIRVDGTIQTSNVENCSKQINLWNVFVICCAPDVRSYEGEGVIKILKLTQITGAMYKTLKPS
jgi:hypothetical protein